MDKKFPRLQAYAFLLLLIVGSGSCSKTSTETDSQPDYQPGKNSYTTEIDGVTREYIVHVQAGYDANSPMPVVFMLHGSTGSGEEKYNDSGWKELAEDENILTVFPTALVYCYTNTFGFTKTATRWWSYPPINHFCPGQNPKDDVKFLRQVVDEVKQRFNVDAKRIYMVGFSSGAQMAFRCAVEMSDLLAAVVQSGATHQVDTVFTPQRNLPIAFELGNLDETWLGGAAEVPMSKFENMLANNAVFQRIINVHTNSFTFESTYTMTGDTSTALTATFKGMPFADNRVFTFTLIKGLDHAYPNTVNHPRNGASVHWAWLKQYSLP